ncbi:MAG: CBS domain-containing protein [Saprospiraceae bacterium]|nr:CBS domain-containing protein [Saprospiraceae bacterium]
MISVQQLLEGKLTSEAFFVTPEHMVIDALELMAAKNIGAVMVMEGDRLVGIFSERDYARKGIIQGRKAKSTPVTEVMTPNVFTVSPTMKIEDCMQLFSDKHIRHLPVVDGSKVVGMLSIGDIVTTIMNEQKMHIDFLEQYISGV